MKTLMHPTLRAVLGILLLLAMWQIAAVMAAWTALPGGIHASVLLMLTVGALLAVLCRRVRSEDQVVRLEADLCREHGARSRADDALLEADRLLARLGSSGAGLRHDPVGQLGLVQAELMQMQNGAADPAVAARIDMLRTRLALVARAVRQTARTAEAD